MILKRNWWIASVEFKKTFIREGSEMDGEEGVGSTQVAVEEKQS